MIDVPSTEEVKAELNAKVQGILGRPTALVLFDLRVQIAKAIKKFRHPKHKSGHAGLALTLEMQMMYLGYSMNA